MRWHYKEIEKRKGVRYNDCRSVTNPPTKNRKVSLLGTGGMQSVLIGSEYPVMDTLLFYFLKSSYCKAFRGVAECYAFSRFHDNVASGIFRRSGISKAPMQL